MPSITTMWTRSQIEELASRSYKNFRGVRIHGGDFSGLDLEKADFRGAAVQYSDFSRCNVRFADFEGANVMFTKWDDAVIHRTNYKDAKLCNADMSKAKDFFGVAISMDCNSFMGLKLKEGYWLGFLFYGLLMEAPSEDWREKLQLFFGPEKYEILRTSYANRRM